MKQLIEELDTRAEKEYISPFNRGLAAAWSDDLNLAFRYIEKAYEDHEPMLLTIKTWRMFLIILKMIHAASN